MTLPDSAKELIRAGALGHLSTIGPDGAPQVTGVAMSRDRLLPPFFAHVSKRFPTPYRSTIMTGVAVALLTGPIPLTTLAELVNIGTLFAFMVVAAGVIVLRRTQPDLHREFRAPLVPVLPAISILASLYLALNLPAETWERFLIWMALGLVVYFAHAERKSRLAEPEASAR